MVNTISPPQVSLAHCADYEPTRVKEALDLVLERIGGIQRFVHPGQRVLIKPNLLTAVPPKRAVTTHPAVVEAVTNLVQQAGGLPLIADSPSAGIPYTTTSLQRLYRVTGMERVAARTGAELNLDIDAVDMPCPKACHIRRFEVMRPLAQADVVISLPKLKTHTLTILTGATKNLFGLLPGFRKASYHVTLGQLDDFADMLLDVTLLANPTLVIMDAVVGMDGDGPSAGRPFPIGLLMVATSSMALDVVAAHVAGIPPMDVPTIRRAAERGLCSGNLEEIERLGPTLEEVRVAGFCRPQANPPLWEEWLPRALRPQIRRFAVRYVSRRPVPQVGRCTACQACETACPVEAIIVQDGLAWVDDRRCIRCYCCHEVCPEQAIELKTPWLAKLAIRLRG